MPKNVLSITSEEALTVMKEIIKKAQADGGKPIAVAIVDVSARLIAFIAMDETPPASIKLSQSKAYSAVIGAKDTINWATFPKNEKFVDFDMRNWTDENFSGFTGGVTINYQNKIIGGIGVSGRKGQMNESDHLLQDHELACFGRETIDNLIN